jgi:hypothetical protein
MENGKMNAFEAALLEQLDRLNVNIETHNQNIETLIETLTEEVEEDEEDE